MNILLSEAIFSYSLLKFLGGFYSATIELIEYQNVLKVNKYSVNCLKLSLPPLTQWEYVSKLFILLF